MSAAPSTSCVAAWRWSRRAGRRLLRLHSAPSFAALWLSPRLARFLRDHPGIEVRLAAGTDYTRFLNDEFDADIVYGLPRVEGLVVVPLGEETVTPLCTPDLARDHQDTHGPVQPCPDRERDQAGPLVGLVRAQRPARPPTTGGSLRPELPRHRRRRRRPRRDAWNRPGSPSARSRAGGWCVPWPGKPRTSAMSGTTWSFRAAPASVTACGCSPNGWGRSWV